IRRRDGPVSKEKPAASSLPTRPPTLAFFSKTSTSKPMAASRIAAASPPIPAPTTATRLFGLADDAARDPTFLFPKAYLDYTSQMLTAFIARPGKGAYRALQHAQAYAFACQPGSSVASSACHTGSFLGGVRSG